MSTTLRLKKKVAPISATTPTSTAPPPVPIDAAHFFIVWRTDGPRPKQRHPSLAAASAERDRLKSMSPGATFFIFECTRVPV